MKKVLVVVLSLAMLSAGCSTAWVATVDSVLAVAAPALTNILQIVAVANGKPLNGSLVAKINADATIIKTLAADFAKVSAGSAPGVCQQLRAAASAYQADQQLVLQAAVVSDSNTQIKITMLANLVAGTVDAILTAIPSCQSAAQSVKAIPPYSVSRFTAEYNTILTTPTGDPAVDATTVRLKLHRHSKVVSVITFGRLN